MARQRLLDRLDGATRQAVLDAGRRVDVAAETFLVHDGDDASGVFVVLDGLLKVTKSSIDGGVSFLGLRRSGTILGELGVLAGASRSSSVEAIVAATVVQIDHGRFRELLLEHPAFRRALLTELAERLSEATGQMHDLMNADARTRVASCLVQLADEAGSDDGGETATIALPVSQDELADWAGLSRAGAVKALRSLRDDGMIETGRMSMTINDLGRLRSSAVA